MNTNININIKKKTLLKEDLSLDTGLVIAASEGRMESVKHFIIKGADPLFKEQKAMFLAVQNGHLEVVKYLQENGCDLHIESDFYAVISVENGHLNIIKYMLQNGSKWSLKSDSNLENDFPSYDFLLNLAVENNYINIVKFMLKNNANINNSVFEPLYLAVLSDNFKMTKFLIDNGATVTNDRNILFHSKNNLKLNNYLKQKMEEQTFNHLDSRSRNYYELRQSKLFGN